MARPLRTTRIKYELDPGKTALIILDMTNDFLMSGAVCEMAWARECIPGLKRLLAHCRSLAIPVLYTVYVHEQSTGHMEDFWLELKDGAMKPGSAGLKIFAEISPKASDVIVEKHSYSAFHGSRLEERLKAAGIDSVIIAGVATNYACYLTAREAQCRDFRVVFLSDATAAMDLPDLGWGFFAHEQVQDLFLTNLALGVADVSTVDEVIAKLGASTPVTGRSQSDKTGRGR